MVGLKELFGEDWVREWERKKRETRAKPVYTVNDDGQIKVYRVPPTLQVRMCQVLKDGYVFAYGGITTLETERLENGDIKTDAITLVDPGKVLACLQKAGLQIDPAENRGEIADLVVKILEAPKSLIRRDLQGGGVSVPLLSFDTWVSCLFDDADMADSITGGSAYIVIGREKVKDAEDGRKFYNFNVYGLFEV